MRSLLFAIYRTFIKFFVKRIAQGGKSCQEGISTRCGSTPCFQFNIWVSFERRQAAAFSMRMGRAAREDFGNGVAHMEDRNERREE
jgi:hypothetical protein